MDVICQHYGSQGIRSFIEAVRKRSCIWDENDSSYSDLTQDWARRKEVYVEVINDLRWTKVSPESLELAWNSLKTEYHLECKKRILLGVAEYDKQSWEFLNDMQFLDNGNVSSSTIASSISSITSEEEKEKRLFRKRAVDRHRGHWSPTLRRERWEKVSTSSPKSVVNEEFDSMNNAESHITSIIGGGARSNVSMKTNPSLQVFKSSGSLPVLGSTRRVVITAPGKNPRVIKLIKSSKTSSLHGQNVPEVKSSCKTLEDALSNLVASAPNVVDIAGPQLSCSQITDKESEQGKMSDHHFAGATSGTPAAVSNQSIESSDCLTKLRSDDEKHNNDILSLSDALHEISGVNPDSSTRGSFSNLSQGSVAPSVNSTAQPLFGEYTCPRCTSEMPVLRRCLGRLESRLESMLTMANSLILNARQNNKSPLNQSASSGSSTQKKLSAAVILRPRSQVSSFDLTPAGQGDARIVGSECDVKASRMNSSSDARTLLESLPQPYFVYASRKQNTTTDDKPNYPSSNWSSNEFPSTSQPSIVKTTCTNPSYLSETPQLSLGCSSPSGHHSNDSAPPVLHMKFSPAPNQPSTKVSYMQSSIPRALLLFQGPSFTVADFRNLGPAVIRNVDDDKLQEALKQLLEDGLLKKVCDQYDLTNPNATYLKQRITSKLSKLADYGVRRNVYITNLLRRVKTES